MASAYREIPLRGRSASVVACVWQRRATAGHTQRVLPDGCLDLVYQANGELVVAGADTGPRMVDIRGGTANVGVRLHDVWGAPAAELEDTLSVAAPAHRQALLLQAVLARAAGPDPLVEAAQQRLSRPHARVATVAEELGVSDRQLHRRTLAAVGYGPKMLARVGRLHRFLTLEEGDLATRALIAGYASQTHLNDEVRRLAGTTPVRLLEDMQDGRS